ncbi:MAG: class I SAM-dependent methyltransferase [Clostridia bacterium]|nr:class I SAM-dependent methyltransferase [Clostridia bacterium]
MTSTFDFLNGYYTVYNENGRLASRHGSVEFRTTVRYIERYLKPGMNILEIGAATGRYSHYFARQSYAVDAVELIPHNIELFREHTQDGENVRIFEGNAVDLSMFADDSYDIVLLLGPMYHLFTDEDRTAALSEAVRVTKPGGVMMASYCMNEGTVINYLFGKHKIFEESLQPLIDRETFKLDSVPEQLFVLWRQEDIRKFTDRLPVERLHFVGTDMYTKYFPDMVDSLDDREFAEYLNYHFAVCERADMVGISHHTLDILRKRG